jgi:hypothetical protein
MVTVAGCNTLIPTACANTPVVKGSIALPT